MNPSSARDRFPFPGRPGSVAALTFVSALILRILYLAVFRESPFYRQLIVDAQWHDAWAWDWARGAGSEPGAFFRAPLYPWWLSVLYRIFGHDLDAVRGVQAILGAATAGLLGYAGSRWFGASAGLATGLLAAGYGPFIHYDAELLIPNLLLVLLAGALAVLASGVASPGGLSAGGSGDRPEAGGEVSSVELRGWTARTATAGLLIGLAGIARPNALVLIPLVTWIAWRGGWHAGGRRSLGAAAWALALALVPALTVTGINAGRETARAGVATQGGINFYAGNHAGATGKSLEIAELADLVSWRELVPRAHALAEAVSGRELSSAEVSAWWFRQGLDWIREHPGDALGLSGQKLYYLMNAYEIPSDRDLYVHATGILRGLLWTVPGLGFPWGLVFPLGVLAFFAFRRAESWSRPVRFLGLWIVLYAASILPFFVTGRFRLGLVPPLLCLAGAALARPGAAFRGRALGIGLAVFVLANSSLFGARSVNLAAEETRRGDALLRDGRPREGLALLEQSYDRDSTQTVTAYLLARGYLEMKEPAAAARYLERVFLARPEDPQVSFELGTAHLAAGHAERAARALEHAAALDSSLVEAWINLGVAYEEQGKPDWALAAYRRGLTQDPAAETGVVRAAGLLLAQDRASDAVTLVERAVERDARSFDLWFTLAVASSAAGDSGRANQALEQAHVIRPEDPRVEALRRGLGAARGTPP